MQLLGMLLLFNKKSNQVDGQNDFNIAKQLWNRIEEIKTEIENAKRLFHALTLMCQNKVFRSAFNLPEDIEIYGSGTRLVMTSKKEFPFVKMVIKYVDKWNHYNKKYYYGPMFLFFGKDEKFVRNGLIPHNFSRNDDAIPTFLIKLIYLFHPPIPETLPVLSAPPPKGDLVIDSSRNFATAVVTGKTEKIFG